MLNAASRLHFGGDPRLAPDRLVHADNRALLGELADGSVDLVYVDPPFGTGAVRRGRGAAYRDVAADPERFVAWLEPCLAESRRVLAAHGSLFVHLDYRTVHYVKVALDRLFGAERLVNEIVWCYSVGGKSRRSFGRKHDTILWYARGRDHAFFPEAVRVPRKPGSHMRAVRGPGGELVQEKTDRKTGKVYRYPVAAGKVPEDWWTDIETLNRGDRERTGWPTQKPERLLERIVAAAAAPGALVADWFAGSGTTAVVAQRMGRRFLAVDRERGAFELAAARLARAGGELAAAGRPPRDIALERRHVHDSQRAEAPAGRRRAWQKRPPAASM
ncbi:MAG TPA: site-specific DNA-methyltransferase [Kofleriaceae bacterium]|nr:site-specific DNA-methyltransferase [Kofleriaceae bacterium]